MRYIGGKQMMLDNILSVIQENTKDVKTIFDPFCGSGVVTNYLKEKGYKTISNDFMYFSYVLQKGITCLNKRPEFKNLNIDNPIDYLNTLKLEDTDILLDECFIYNNYTPNKECERMYFQNNNALKIDVIRITIEKWRTNNLINENEYFYLLSSLIEAVPYISNITGVYSAYLKYWDKRTFKPLVLKEPKIIKSRYKHETYNLDANILVSDISSDLTYIDTPYNERQYLPNYHILETIAKYDYPEIKGKTGMRDYSNQKSAYCKKNEVYNAFFNLLLNSNTKYVLISYNNESLLSTNEMLSLLQIFAKNNMVKLYEYPYRRYQNKSTNSVHTLKEQLYFIELKTKNDYIKSPMNYIGGKYKILNQIDKYFPLVIDNFVDLFAGGLDVSININAKNIVANDINYEMINMYQKMQTISSEDLIMYIEKTINKWGLSTTNKNAYNEFRKYYNKYKNPLDLYVLLCFSFNHQIRFNNNIEFNAPFGLNRSSFNNNIRSNLIKFHQKIKNIIFISSDFRNIDINRFKKDDFFYVDPPYLISCGSYNDGNRGFGGWTENDEKELLIFLDKLNEKGIKFALSNVFQHKNKKNNILIEWSKKYNVYNINNNYNNSNYRIKDKHSLTQEVLIINYDIENLC